MDTLVFFYHSKLLYSLGTRCSIIIIVSVTSHVHLLPCNSYCTIHKYIWVFGQENRSWIETRVSQININLLFQFGILISHSKEAMCKFLEYFQFEYKEPLNLMNIEEIV